MTSHPNRKIQRISIEWDTGRPQTGADEDERRAAHVAEAILDALNVDYQAAQAAYDAQMDVDHDPDENDPQTALARVWSQAQSAANVALTEGWYNPNGAYCTIRAA